ncbi:MAG: hypothetical protein RSD06_04920 [Bacilli bacterium]
MYKKISSNEKITRKVNEQHCIDNYLTKEITESMSLSIAKLNGELKTEKSKNERGYYFIKAKVKFIIDGEKVIIKDGDVLYIQNDTDYSAKGMFQSVIVNTPAYGVLK